MKLQMKEFKVTDVKFASDTTYQNGILTINKMDLMTFAMDGVDDVILDLKIAKPGDKTRITHVMDAVKPIYKPRGATFPGLVDKYEKVGASTTMAYDGVAIIQTGTYPGLMEGIIDMAGAGSQYSYFSKTINLVVELSNTEGLSNDDFEKLSKEIPLRIGKYITQATIHQEPTSIQTYEKSPCSKNLEKIGYVCYMESLGQFRNVFLYGEDTTEMKPKYIHPNELLDGALVSHNFEIAAHKNPTYFHQCNPIVKELYRCDGVNLSFEGVILSPERGVLEIKESHAKEIARIAEELGLTGVVISKEGGGHADADLMLCVKAMEEKGIKTVITLNEISGEHGNLPPIVSGTEEANAVISNGNNDELVTLDAVETLMGGNKISGIEDPMSGFMTSLGLIYCSTNQLGMNSMTITEY